MNVLEIIGGLAVFVVLVKTTYRFYRKYYPKKYNWDNCPNDHDTMSRYGYEGKCDKCGNEMQFVANVQYKIRCDNTTQK